MNISATQYTTKAKQNARSLRDSQTDAEGLLWHYLRDRRLAGHKFRRQHPLGNYVADFACLPKRLIVELDGGQHGEQQDYDQQRDAYLHAQGFRVLRFWNHEVLENCHEALQRIHDELQAPQP